MRSEPVLTESADIKIWNRLDEIDSLFRSGRTDKAKGYLMSTVEEVSVSLNPVHSAVLVRMLNMASEENVDDIQSFATKVMEKCSLSDSYPEFEVADIMVSEGNTKFARFILERKEDVSDRAFMEYLLGRIHLKEGDPDQALDHFLISNGIDPMFIRSYDYLNDLELGEGWDVRKNIALLRSGMDAQKAERSFSNTALESLYRVYWEWYKGDKTAAKNMLAVSVSDDDIIEFRLAAARIYLMDGDAETSVMFFKDIFDEMSDPYMYVEFADALVSAGRPSEAIPLLSSIAAKDPLNRGMMECRIRALAAIGSKTECRNRIEDLLQSEHADRRGYELCARTLSSIGENKESSRLIGILISRFPDDHELFILRSENELAAERTTSALEAADEAVKMASRDPDARYQRAKILYKLNKIKKATRDIDAALSADPEHIPAYMLLKEIQVDQKNYKGALETCNRVLEIDPKNADVMRDKAYLLETTGDNEGSLNEYRNALRTKDDKALFEDVLTKLVSSQRYDEVMDLYNEFGETYDSSSVMWRLKGNVEYAQKQYDLALASFIRATELSPYEPQLWHSRGMAAEQIPQLKKAEDAYDKALLLDLDNSEYWLSRAVIQEKRGNLKGAVHSLNRVISESPDSMFALVRKALILVRLEKYDEAIFFIDMALKINPKDLTVQDIKKGILKHISRQDQVVRTADDILLNDPKNREALEDKTRALLSMEKYDKAAESATRALKAYPMDLTFLYMKKSAMRAMDDYEGEVDVCQQILTLEPNNRQVKMDMAESMAAAGNAENAMAVYDQLHAEDPTDIKVVVMKSKVRSSMGDGSKAVELFQEALESNPDDPETLNTLAGVMFNEGLNEEAVRVLDNAIKMDPADTRNHKLKAQILLADKNYEAAEEALREALKADLNDPQIWRSMGEIQEARRDMHQALLSYDSAMKMGMDDAEMYISRGRVQEALEMDDAAINSYSIASMKEPRDIRSLVMMAEIQIRLDRLSAAAQNLDNALNIDPEDPDALFARAKVHVALGQNDEAKDLYEHFVALDLQGTGISEDFCELVGGDRMTVPSYRQAETEKRFRDDLDMYSHMILEYCYNTGYAIKDRETFQEAGVPEGMMNDILNYLGSIDEYGDLDIGSNEFWRMERLSRNLVLTENLVKIESEPIVSLPAAYMASGAASIDEAKTLVAYIYKVLTEDVEPDVYPDEVAELAENISSSTGDITLFGIIERSDVGVCYAKMAKDLSGKMSGSIGDHI